MATIINLQFTEFKAARVIGKTIWGQVNPENNPLPAFWDQCLNDGTFTTLENMKEYVVIPDYIGWMGEYDPATGKFLYIVGMLMQPDAPVPEGYVYRDLPECTMGIAWIKGRESDGEIYREGMNLTLAALGEKGYHYDDAAGYAVEVYNYERFVIPMQQGEPEVVLDYYAPCQSVE
jgi:predicted transcriptional regulator YdeE